MTKLGRLDPFDWIKIVTRNKMEIIAGLQKQNRQIEIALLRDQFQRLQD